MTPSNPNPPPSPLLERIGGRVRRRRQALDLTLKALAERSGLSPRFVSQLEAGHGNIAIGRLDAVAAALGVPLAWLVDDAADDTRDAIGRLLRGRDKASLHTALAALEVLFDEVGVKVIVLLGLRGAGKSTVGRHVAAALAIPFVELDARIEAEAGLTLGAIFELHGEPYYRRLETRCLLTLLAHHQPVVVALGGGIVHNEDAFELVRRRCVSVWLRARPEEHMHRVQRQGDQRPMTGRRDAMAELRAILSAREPLYRMADHHVDTSGASVEEVAAAVVRAAQKS